VDGHRIGIRYGDFYARRLTDDLGFGTRNGVVRMSLVHDNTLEETNRLIRILDQLL
jgi:selenocysteine lyase/cysteine desulfurase